MRLKDMESDEFGPVGALRSPDPALPRWVTSDNAEAAVGALYQAQALPLIRLAYITLGDRASAEDMVQDAFCGLFKRWDSTSGQVVIVSGIKPGASAGILRDHHYTPIPWAPGVVTAAW